MPGLLFPTPARSTKHPGCLAVAMGHRVFRQDSAKGLAFPVPMGQGGPVMCRPFPVAP
ncbi:MAG: hypothetical protein LBP92_00035 [Deltaproteobacteria bacterium]|nr:hypothetical protein [Deltaproteobacteria bacterium]